MMVPDTLYTSPSIPVPYMYTGPSLVDDAFADTLAAPSDRASAQHITDYKIITLECFV